MGESNFVDYVKTYCRSGKGGKGSTYLRREKTNAKGGPDGGDGGRGGHIIIRGNNNYWTLIHLKYNRHVFAKNGGDGSRSSKFGANGQDAIIDVPLGTIVKDGETNKYITEIVAENEQLIILKGGKGGLGNVNFKSPTRQTPRYAQPGEKGTEQSIILELKVLADVGLVGFPNAGKSTLLSVLSDAKPKIANYPFTTLEPHLGIVKYRDNLSFAVADIPGIIENAHKGKGLGHRFLRHIERNATLLFIIPADSNDIYNEYKILLNELKSYNPELLDKQRILAISKLDLLDDELQREIEKELPNEVPHIFISSVAQKGLNQLKDILWESINKS